MYIHIHTYTRVHTYIYIHTYIHVYTHTSRVCTDPDRERSVLAADSAATVRAAGLRRAAVLLLLLKDLWVEFLQKEKEPDQLVGRQILMRWGVGVSLMNECVAETSSPPQ